ncbi:hypothetical protein [Streptomyces sp. NPDC002692]
MKIQRLKPRRIFTATGGGVGVLDDQRCGHGGPILTFHLFSRLPGHARDDLGVLMPECVASQLFGAALAYVQAEEGEAAGERFLAEVLSARDQALEQLTAFQAQEDAHARACCEAGSRTGGREHTCRHDSASES